MGSSPAPECFDEGHNLTLCLLQGQRCVEDEIRSSSLILIGHLRKQENTC